LQPALGPQRVEPALDAERGQVAVPDLREISDLADDLRRPVVAHAHALAENADTAEEALHVRVRVAREVSMLRLSMPSSSAVIIAKCAQRAMSKNRQSPCA
jgi:hypothetical protein